MIFRDIPGFEGRYAITKSGKVWSYPKSLTGCLKDLGYTKGKWLKIFETNGYDTVRLGAGKMIAIHRLLALTYIPNPNNKCVINHIDGNKKNNKLKNLEWVTQGENNTHAWKIGLCRPSKKLTPEQVRNIRKFYGKGITQENLAYDFKVGRATIYRVLKGIGY